MIDNSSVNNFTSEEILKQNPFSGYLRSIPGGVGVISEEYNIVKELLEDSEVKQKIPPSGKFLWSNKFESAQDEVGNIIEYR